MNCTTDLNQIQECLNSPNLLLIYPTEAVFGIGCKANNFKAIQLIQKLKRRSPKKAFVVLAGNVKQLDYLTNPNIPKEIKNLVIKANTLNYLSKSEFVTCLNELECELYNKIDQLLFSDDSLIKNLDNECYDYTCPNYQLARSVSNTLGLNDISITNHSKLEKNKLLVILSLCLKLLVFYHPRTINITFILPCNPNINIPVELLGLDSSASLVQKQQATVAIRYTHLPNLVEITKLAQDIPLVSTSCNISGKDPLLSPQQILDEFGEDDLTKQIVLFNQTIVPTIDPCNDKIPTGYNYLRNSSPQNTSIIVDIFNHKVLRNGKFLKLQNGFKFINPEIYNHLKVLLSLCAYHQLEINFLN